MGKNKPTIKGLFVKTHLKVLEKQQGSVGLQALEEKCGKPLRFSSWANIPISDEVEIINCILQMISNPEVPGSRLDYEAGRFHFENFLTTPLAKGVMARFGKNFNLMMLIVGKIAGRVFRGVKVGSEILGENKVKIFMENWPYPLEHFEGFFEAWLSHLGLMGIARGAVLDDGNIEYVITWKEQ